MNFDRFILCLSWGWGVLALPGLPAQELPLPVADPAAVFVDEGVLQPTTVIKPPLSRPVLVPANAMQREQEKAILALERKLVEEQARRRIAEAHQSGAAGALKQVIVVNGPMEPSLSRAGKPPQHGSGKVALVGIKDSEVAKSLEGFFGAPMTPERERALLKTVKERLAVGGGKEVRLAGWWPVEGVIAVSVLEGGS